MKTLYGPSPDHYDRTRLRSKSLAAAEKWRWQKMPEHRMRAEAERHLSMLNTASAAYDALKQDFRHATADNVRLRRRGRELEAAVRRLEAALAGRMAG